MKKNFVFDTNVLLHDPRALFMFQDNNVIVPIYVIEELDKFKKNSNELGRNARQSSRSIDEYRLKGNLSGEGCQLPGGGFLRVLFADPKAMQSDYFSRNTDNDSLILGVGLTLSHSEPEVPVVILSKDTNVRIRANALGLRAEDFEVSDVDIDELYSGFSEHFTSGQIIDQLFDKKQMSVEDLKKQILLPENGYESSTVKNNNITIYPNQFLQLVDAQNNRHNAIVRVEPDGQTICTLNKRSKESIWGIKAKNREQSFALDLLLDDRIKLVTLVGKAGTGKTLLAIAAGLQSVVEERIHSRLLVTRPILPMGKDLGFLPGTMEEKLFPWMQPIFDNIDFLMGAAQEANKKQKSYEELLELDYLQIEALTYIRGRSIPQQFLIVDEAQNLTPHEVKTIVSRAGDGTKVILTGDPYQIDHPYVDSSNNGLVHAVNRMVGQNLAGHITLQKGERSELAEIASNLL